MSLKTSIFKILLNSFLSSDMPVVKIVGYIKTAYETAAEEKEGVITDTEQFLASLKSQGFSDELIAAIKEVGSLVGWSTDKITEICDKAEVAITASEQLVSQLETLVESSSTSTDDTTA